MKKALVCGAGGFIGGHLVKRLKREGYWVRGVDIKNHEFHPSAADEFLVLDLREEAHLTAGHAERVDLPAQLAREPEQNRAEAVRDRDRVVNHTNH